MWQISFVLFRFVGKRSAETVKKRNNSTSRVHEYVKRNEDLYEQSNHFFVALIIVM